MKKFQFCENCLKDTTRKQRRKIVESLLLSIHFGLSLLALETLNHKFEDKLSKGAEYPGVGGQLIFLYVKIIYSLNVNDNEHFAVSCQSSSALVSLNNDFLSEVDIDVNLCFSKIISEFSSYYLHKGNNI
uniref:Uncharacterized protein n=1 Tax=Glossina pallidipes TaxID=7398 RepID=A0A1A9ZAM1_GLOPL